MLYWAVGCIFLSFVAYKSISLPRVLFPDAYRLINRYLDYRDSLSLKMSSRFFNDRIHFFYVTILLSKLSTIPRSVSTYIYSLDIICDRVFGCQIDDERFIMAMPNIIGLRLIHCDLDGCLRRLSLDLSHCVVSPQLRTQPKRQFLYQCGTVFQGMVPVRP